MRGYHRVQCLLAGAFMAAAGYRLAARQTSQFLARTDAVVLDVTVRDGQVSVTDLTSADFRVSDNGVVQQVRIGAARDVPLDLWVLTDNGFLVQGALQRRRFPERVRAIAGLLRPGDRIAVLTIAYPMQEIVPLSPVPLATLPAIPMQGQEIVTDGVADALLIHGQPGRRHVIIAQSMGVDLASSTEARLLPDLAARSDALLDLAYSTSPPRERRDFLLDAARLTGGTSFRAKDVEDAVRQTLASLEHVYVLTYTARGVPGRGWHTIDVSVTRPGKVTIGVRRGYFVQ